MVESSLQIELAHKVNRTQFIFPSYIFNGKPIYDPKDAPKFFVKFVKVYNKNYTDLYDLLTHYDNFKQNLENINEANIHPDQISAVAIGPMSDTIIP